MNRKKNVTAIGEPDAQIFFLKAPLIQYEQILLTKNFRQYLETMGIQKTASKNLQVSDEIARIHGRP